MINNDRLFPQFLNNGNGQLRLVADGLYVGGMDAVLWVPESVRFVLDLHDRAQSSSTRELRIERFPHVCRTSPEDGHALRRWIFQEALHMRAQSRFLRVDFLISCSAGCSRSVSLAYGVLRMEGFGHDEALRRCQLGPEPDNQPAKKTLESIRSMAEFLLPAT